MIINWFLLSFMYHTASVDKLNCDMLESDA
jgi:hypothetical protein